MIYTKHILITSLLTVISITQNANAADHNYYLNMPFSCNGEYNNTAHKYEIAGWNGRALKEHSKEVYDFSISCNGKYKSIIDVFLSTTTDNRFKRVGSTLYVHKRDESKSVKVSEGGCETYYVDDYCSRTPKELYGICHGDPACEIEFSAYRCKQPKQRCWQPKYENRYFPVWEPFTPGYSPLPTGASITKSVVTAPKTSALSPISTDLNSSKNNDIQPSIIFLGILALAALAFVIKVLSQSGMTKEHRLISSVTSTVIVSVILYFVFGVKDITLLSIPLLGGLSLSVIWSINQA